MTFRDRTMQVHPSTEISRLGRKGIVLTGENDSESTLLKFENESGKSYAYFIKTSNSYFAPFCISIGFYFSEINISIQQSVAFLWLF